jgi:hypothetical protein
MAAEDDGDLNPGTGFDTFNPLSDVTCSTGMSENADGSDHVTDV